MQRETRQAFNQHDHKIVHITYQNGKHKKFHRYIKDLTILAYPPLQKDGQSYIDSRDKEILNDYFSSVFTRNKNDSLPDTGESLYLNIPEINLQASGIKKLLKGLDPSKATGPDNILAKFLKLFAEDLSKLCLYCFQLPSNRVSSPQKAMVAPTFKKVS